VTHCNDNELTVWNIDEQRIIKEVKLDRPEYVQLKNDKIYVTSALSFETVDNKKNSTVKLKSGSNCIFVLDKLSLNIERTIEFDDWLQPAGLYIDSDENILTTAYLWDKNRVKSECRYLFFINQNDIVEDRLCLNDIKNFDDMTIQDDKAIFYVWQALKIIEFK
jgi:hypothetical protein